MPEYRTPLPAILAGMLEASINRILALDEDSPVRLQRLDDRLLNDILPAIMSSDVRVVGDDEAFRYWMVLTEEDGKRAAAFRLSFYRGAEFVVLLASPDPTAPSD